MMSAICAKKLFTVLMDRLKFTYVYILQTRKMEEDISQSSGSHLMYVL